MRCLDTDQVSRAGTFGCSWIPTCCQTVFQQYIHANKSWDIHIDSVIQLTWKRWKGVGSGQKFAFLARGQPWSKIQDMDSSVIESSTNVNQHRCPEASKRRPMGWWKKPTWTSPERTPGMWHIWSIAAEVLYLHRIETYRFTSLCKQWHRKDEQNHLHQPQTSNRGRLCSRGPYEILRHTLPALHLRSLKILSKESSNSIKCLKITAAIMTGCKTSL